MKREYFLSVTDTAEIIEKMNGVWAINFALQTHNSEQTDTIFLEWVNFFDNAKKGSEIAIKTARKRTITAETDKLNAYLLFQSALMSTELPTGSLNFLRNALGSLLSSDAREKYEKRSKKKLPPTDVDAVQMGQIYKFVRSFKNTN